MKILVIGSGGREHALAHTFWRQGHSVLCYPGNPGIHAIAPPLTKETLSLEALADLVKASGIDLTVVGPEAPLEQGIADLFAKRGLALFGPTQSAARMESSKAWSKAFMKKHRVPTARFMVCNSQPAALLAARGLFAAGKKAVVKPSGLTGGKGVVCCQSFEEAAEAVRQIFEEKLYGSAGSEVVVEEQLFGPEVSLMAICDGKRMVPLLAAQDHKRLLDHDLGPNTGGMGAYAPYHLVDNYHARIEQEVIAPTLKGLLAEEIAYHGILYFGLMLTEEGPKVLEYNCRFGDPETQAILPLLKSDLASHMVLAVRGDLSGETIRWKEQASCCVVLASEGYPAAPKVGRPIGELPKDALLFHAGTALDSQGNLVTAGGRVLGVTGLGDDPEEAIVNAYAAIEGNFAWAHYRRDIGRAALSSAV